MHRFYKILIALLLIVLLCAYFIKKVQNEVKNAQFHITIVGHKEDHAAQDLYKAAKKYAPNNATVEWWDPKNENQSSSKVKYKMLDKPAAYVCITYRCSMPAFTPNKLLKLIQHYTNYFQIISPQASQKPFSQHTEKIESVKSTLADEPMNVSKNNEQARISHVLQTNNFFVIMPIFWFLGLLLSITPCLLPLMLIITSILGGSVETIPKMRAFFLSFTYVFVLAVTYAVAGMLVASFGFYLQGYMQNKWILGSFSLIFILLGISLFGFFSVQLPTSWRRAIFSQTKYYGSGSYIGVAILGILAMSIASPCVTAPLAGILAYIAETGNVKLGAMALFATGLGIGSPVILVNIIGMELLHKSGQWQIYIKEFFGILLIGMAIWLLGRIISAQLTMFLWAGLVIFTAIYMGALDNTPKPDIPTCTDNKSLLKIVSSLIKMLSLMLLVYGGALFFGALTGNTNPISPLGKPISQEKAVKINLSSFQKIKDLNELKQIIHQSNQDHRPVLILFSADWCASCKELESGVIPKQAIQELLNNYVLLHVDLTDVDSDGVEVAKYYNIIGPPAILLFDGGSAKPKSRVDGEITVERLVTELKVLLKKI